jgi:HAD superfamily hydrolase (TIGR01509 family)
MYRAVFFDAFNTLFSLRCPVGSRARQLPMQKGRFSEFLHRFDAHLQAAYGRVQAGAPGEAGPLARLFATVADVTGMSRTGPFALWLGPEGIVRHWLSMYADVLSTLQALTQVCQLGVISNGWPQLERFLDLLGIRSYFASVTISAQVGLSKPNPAIFELALRNLGIGAGEAIFVDDMPYNVLGAAQMGLQALWLLRAPMEASAIPERYRQLTRIQSLEQVTSLALGA